MIHISSAISYLKSFLHICPHHHVVVLNLRCRRSCHNANENLRNDRDLADRGHWHFHQLFHQLLRLRRLQALRGGVLDDLGHVDNLLINSRRELGNDLQDVHRLVYHLRHRNIERWQRRRAIGKVLHGVPLNLHHGWGGVGWGG